MRKTLVALTCAVACLMSCVFTSCSSCNKKSDKDFAAEITRIMNDFQKLCENTYTNESMDEQQKEAFLDSRYDSLCNVLMDLTDEAMEAHKADSLSVDALEFQVQLQLVSDEDALRKLDALDPAVRQSASAIKLRGTLESKINTTVGKHFMDFSAVQPDGRVIRLSDFAGRGKYCLVDFWASWCGPCKHEMEYLRDIYKKYTKKGLCMVSVAVWDDPQDTKAEAENQHVEWNQIPNAQSIPTELYGIEGIPHIMLINPDGVIVARDLRGEKIAEELDKYL